MNHTEFFNSIKGGKLKNAYLFHGEEEFIKETALETLYNAAVPEKEYRDFNIKTLETAKADELTAACETMPFLSERRVVVCRSILKEDEGKRAIKYLESIPPETVLVFYIKGKADGKTSMVKRFKEMGAIVEFNRPDEGEAARWAMQHAAKRGCAISGGAARYFITLVGCEMLNVANELHKLADYAGPGNEITKDMISSIVTRNIEYRIFSMFDYFINGKMQDGFRALDGILGAKPEEEAMSVAGYLLSCFKNMLAVYDLNAAGLQAGEICSRLNLRDFAVRGILQNIKGYSRDELVSAISGFCDVAYMRISGLSGAKDALVSAIMKHFG